MNLSFRMSAFQLTKSDSKRQSAGIKANLNKICFTDSKETSVLYRKVFSMIHANFHTYFQPIQIISLNVIKVQQYIVFSYCQDK